MTSLMVIQYSALKRANCCLFRPCYLVEPSLVSNRAATCLGIESHRFLRMFLLFPKIGPPLEDPCLELLSVFVGGSVATSYFRDSWMILGFMSLLSMLRPAT